MTLAQDLLALSRKTAPAGVAGLPALYVRYLTVGDMMRLREEKGDAMSVSVLLGASDADGVRVFGDDAIADVRLLPFDVSTRISAAVLAFNGLSGGAVEEEGKAGRTP